MDPDRLGLVGALEAAPLNFSSAAGVICNVTCNQDSDPPLKLDAMRPCTVSSRSP
jgi:hypothetical protein